MVFRRLSGGLILRFPDGNITPFVHGLVGAALVGGPYFEPNKWGPDLTAGGGMDYETPWLNHHLAIRLFQADYEYMHADWGPVRMRRARKHQRSAVERRLCVPCGIDCAARRRLPWLAQRARRRSFPATRSL